MAVVLRQYSHANHWRTGIWLLCMIRGDARSSLVKHQVNDDGVERYSMCLNTKEHANEVCLGAQIWCLYFVGVFELSVSLCL